MAGLSSQGRRWLAGIYRKLAAGPLPGQSDLDVRPHPRLPNTYTVPFLGGHLVYAVFEGDEEGLVGVLYHER